MKILGWFVYVTRRDVAVESFELRRRCERELVRSHIARSYRRGYADAAAAHLAGRRRARRRLRLVPSTEPNTGHW